MRPVFVSSAVSSLRTAQPRLAGALALAVALLPMTLASPAVHAASGTVIESFGSTSLVQVGGNFYFYPVGGSSGPLFKYRGSPVAVGQYEWSYIGAEQTASGYQVALRVAGKDQYTVWNTDSNGNFVSNGTGGVVVSGASSVLKSLEPSFRQDLNGDGIIGGTAAPSGTVIESFGSTSLVQVGSNFYFYPVGGSSGPLFKYRGSPVAVGQYEWSYIGAEQTASGYQVALRIAGTDQYTVWNTDSNGNFVSNGTGGVIVSGSSSVLKSLEPSFRQDLNGDGVVGVAAAPVSGVCGSANGTTVSSKPSANLCSAGTASSVAGSGPWTWNCGGSNGGATASCTASLATPTPTPTPTPTSTPTPGPVSGNCGIQSGGTGVAFCETFNQGPSAIRGRGGDLDPSKWATARLSGEFGLSGPGTANPVAIAPIPQCRAGITQSSVFPPNDTLICDPSGTRSSRLMTAVSMQNYGVNSYMIRQPFDFAGRTGKIAFDVDAVDQGGLGGFIEIELTEDPTPATTFREFQNFEVGPVPRNGLTLRFGSFGECPNAVAPVNTLVYKNYVGTIVTPTFNHSNGCAKTSRGSLNHFEIHVSQNRIDVYGSDFSTDNGQTFPNSKLLYSANISLPFTRGYLHFNPRNHATAKYGFGPDVVFHWDNIGFDGPVIAAPRAYEIPDNTVVTSHNGSQVQNLGYQLLDGTTGKAAGIYNLSTKINSLTFQNVNTSGITSATLTMNAFFNAGVHTANTNWGISYRFNGGTWRNRNLTAGDIAAINAIAGAPLGQLSLSLDVPTTDLVSGNNTLELLPLNVPMDYPPVVANIDLLLGTPGSVSSPTPSPVPAPTVAISASPTSMTSGKVSTVTWSSTNATSCTAGGGWTGTKAPSGTLTVSPPSTTTYTLTCTGSGGTSPAASTTVAVNAGPAPVGGVCGSANGTTVSSSPTAGLCSAGTASSVAGSGPWTWSCGGSNGGASASCSASAGSGSGGGGSTPAPGPVAGNCGMQLGSAVSFCETFDTKNPGIPSRTGDLDPNVWGVSRAIGDTNFNKGMYNGWAATTQLQTCNGTKTVSPPNDIMICNGQLRQASNDNPTGAYDAGTVTVLAMYPKQPFDFAGRTGTVSFDISNDSHGTHAAWPEFWMSNLPIPAPFNHFDSWQSLPEHGFGIRFAAAAPAGQYGFCPNGNNLDKRRWTVDSAVVIRNYVMDDTVGLGGVRTRMAVKQLDCVVSPPDDSGITNHVELRISQNQIDIYATDAGVAPSPANLKRIAVVTDANLSMTRGLIWIQDVHYNADKAESGPNVPSQKQHTFVWDNVAFDGPFTYRDFSYDALDVNQPNAATKTVDLGKPSLPNQTASWNVLNMPANPKAATVRVLFNFWQRTPVSKVLNVIVNGHAHSTPWPYPDSLGYTWRTYAVTIPITDLVPGTNVVQIGSDQDMITSNVNIVLVDVPGGVPVLPGSNNAYPGGGTSGGGNSGGGSAGGNIPLPTVAISASPTSVTSGKVSTVTWSSTNATSCTAAGGWTGVKAPSGTLTVSPPNTTTYTLTCTGSGGTSPAASATVAVNAGPAPVGGACGSANGTTASSKPSTNLCSAGTASSVAGSGPWTWSCGGSNGGTTASCSASVSVSGGGSTPPSGGGSTTPTPVSGNCGLQLGSAAVFCDTFDSKNPGIPSRTGDLNPNVWGVSRTSGGNKWATTRVDACNGLTAKSASDLIICNGQLRQASNDNHDVTVLAMYPKQPFDWAGRTGTVAFDVSNDTQGTHAAWPEFWISDTPVPAPFSHFNSWISLPKNGLGIRFAANAEIGQYGICPNGNNLNKRRFTVDSAVVIRNYAYEDVASNGLAFAYPAGGTGMKLNVLDCVTASPGPNGPLNHMEIRVAQNLLEVWASDAGSTALRKIATITNPNLSFSRGLVWIQDGHYNASKGACAENGFSANPVCQTEHTYTWDNVAFDGPFTYRDFSYDALDNSTTPDSSGLMEIAKTAPPNQMTTWNVLNMPANPQAASVRVLFNWKTYFGRVPGNLIVKVNGHGHTVPYPYPANDTLATDGTSFGVGSWRTYPLTIPITELVAGTNVVEIGTDVQNDNTMISNVNIVLVDVPGGVPVLPGSNNAYPASQASR